VSARQTPIRLDLNNPEFQSDLFSLTKEQQRSLLLTLGKLFQMSWDQVYRDAGLKWEAVESKTGPHGGKMYSLRISQSFRALVYREGDWLRILSLHPDHDSAYE
jgi:hypothetical protein